MFDELIRAIETVRDRIRDHAPSLRQNETRTRMALIDPLLTILGWDIAEPALVTPEYNVGSGRADYALLGDDGQPRALIEAKHLGEPLEGAKNQEQVFTYALMQQVKYAGLTDGDLWVLDDVSDFSSGNRRRLSVSIAKDPVYKSVLNLMALWRPNLASGQPVVAKPPIVGLEQPPSPESVPPPPAPAPDGNWTPLSKFHPKPKDKFPSVVRLPDERVSEIRYQRSLLIEIAEFLVRTGKLTHVTGTIASGPSRYICHSTPLHKSGKEFIVPHKLSNGLFLETHNAADLTAKYAKSLLDILGEDPERVSIKFN